MSKPSSQTTTGTPPDFTNSGELRTTVVPKDKWTSFLDDLSRRRFGWSTTVEVMNNTVGAQFLSEGLTFNGLTHEDKGGKCTVEISLGDHADRHQTHSIVSPVRIAYMNETELKKGVLEIAEEDTTKTLITFLRPMPVSFGYAFYDLTVGS